MIRWNIGLVKEFVDENGGGDKLLSDKYVDANKKLSFLCHICKLPYAIVWSSFKDGHRHQICANRKTAENRKYKVEDIKDYLKLYDYILINQKYVNGYMMIEALCPMAHNISMSFYDFKTGHRCKYCYYLILKDRFRFTFEFVSKMIKKFGDGDIVESNIYLNESTPLIIKCHICGRQYISNWDKFRCGYRCASCSHKIGRKKQISKTITENYNFGILNEDLLSEWDWENNLISPYEYLPNSSYKANWICKFCGEAYLSAINNRVSGNTGCPHCNSSKGEIKIKSFFDKNKINYISQFKFNDCKNERCLPFDYYLPHLNTCVEYQGKQHYYSVDKFGGEESLNKQKFNDKIKLDYCRDNNISLLEIPYWEFKNIDLILTKELDL